MSLYPKNSLYPDNGQYPDVATYLFSANIKSDTVQPKLFRFDVDLKSTDGLTEPLSGSVTTLRDDGKFGGAVAVEESHCNKLVADFSVDFSAGTGWRSNYITLNGDGSATFSSIDDWYYLSTSVSGYLSNELVPGELISFSGKYKVNSWPADATKITFAIRFINSEGSSAGYLTKSILKADASEDYLERFEYNSFNVYDDTVSIALLAYFNDATDATGSITISEWQLEKCKWSNSFTTIGSDNKVATNPGFEDGDETGWSWNCNSTYATHSVVSDKSKYGTYSHKMVQDGVNSGAG